MESEIQLIAIQQNRSGNVGSTGGDKKRAPQEEGERESSQRPPFKKFKPNQNSQPSQPFKPRQSGGQSSSSSRPAGSQFLRPVPGQGLICFKYGKPHHSSECTFSGAYCTCGKEGHMAVVCKRNPDSIIKWQKSNSASSAASSRGSAPSVGAPHGAVHMMASAPPAPYQ